MSAADQVTEAGKERGGDFGTHIVEIVINNTLTKSAGGTSDKKGEFTLHPVKEGSVYLQSGSTLVQPLAATIPNSVIGGKFDNHNEDAGTKGVVAYAIPGSSKMLVVYFYNPFSDDLSDFTVKLAIQPVGPANAGLLKKVADLKGDGLTKVEDSFYVDNQGYKLTVTTSPSIAGNAGTLLIPVTFTSAPI